MSNRQDESSAADGFAGFGKFVPGFDFLQNLVTQTAASAAKTTSLGGSSGMQMPGLGGWIAPTMNVEELDRRIKELKAVQFWLDQNATALKATVTALEVQKMTLATLKDMNFNMNEVASAFKAKATESFASMAPAAPDKGKAFAGLEMPTMIFGASAPEAPEPPAAPEVREEASAAAPATNGVDPMQWWGALTQQFQAIAAEAMKEVGKANPLEASKSMAVGMANDAVKTATGLAKNMTEAATKSMAGGTRAAMKNAMGASWPTPVGAKASATAAPPKAAAKPAAKAVAKAAVKAVSKTGAAAKTPAPARKKAGAAARKTTR